MSHVYKAFLDDPTMRAYMTESSRNGGKEYAAVVANTFSGRGFAHAVKSLTDAEVALKELHCPTSANSEDLNFLPQSDVLDYQDYSLGARKRDQKRARKEQKS